MLHILRICRFDFASGGKIRNFAESSYLTMVSQEQFDLSLKESNALKGVALILLLIHHLFYIQNGLYDDVHLFGTQINFVLIFANVCKVCVAIFVLLSGYACAKTVEIASAKDVGSFYRRRFKKLFVNYWLST